VLLRQTARFLPTYLRWRPRCRWFTFAELRFMAYLEVWQTRAAEAKRAARALRRL